MDATSESDETSSDVTSQVPQCGSGCFLPLLEEEDRSWSSFLQGEEAHEGGRVVDGLRAIRKHEELFLRKIHSLRPRPTADSSPSPSPPSRPSRPRLALAFSGGGVRAAFVATGVLWRLAASGRLKDVDYISGVSGGTYAATAFASHLVALKAPEGENLDRWYRRVVAKMISRMQNNTPYLSRDLCHQVPRQSQRGSGALPRCCDVPQLFLVVLGTVLRAPLGFTALLILPLVEVIEVLYGNDMRAEFCRDVFSSKHLVLSVFGCSTTQQQVLVLLTMLATAILVHLGQSFLKQYIDQKSDEKIRLRRALCWMFLRSCLSVIIRLLCCWLLLSVLIAGPVTWRLQRYGTVLGGTELRYCQCAKFIRSENHCGVVGETDSQLPRPYSAASAWALYANLTQIEPVECNLSTGSAKFRRQHESLMEEAQAWLLQRPLGETFLPVFLLLVVLVLISAALLLPIVPEFFVLVFNIFVPVLLFAFTFFLVQFRVLGAITQERYFGFSLNRERWNFLLQVSLVGAMIGLGFSRFMRTFMHRYYSRSLQRAFYANGETCTWADVRQNIYCPMLLVNATVNDYMQLGDTKPFSYMTFTQLFAGGERLGYFASYGQRPLARTAALSGGAIDGFIMANYDSMSLRFWLEASGFFMGDFVCISRRPGEWVRVQRFLALAVLEVVYLLLFSASWLASHGEISTETCQVQYRLVQLAAWWGLIFGILSFFSFFNFLGWLQHSPVIRIMQQATMFYYQSPRAPRSVYLSDGGVLENTGILALLQRRQRRILAVYTGEESVGQEMGCLQKLLQMMHDEDIGYLYNLEDPRRGPLHAIRDCVWTDGYLLELGICYYDDVEKRDNILTVLRNKVPPGRSLPIWQHLSEEEVMGAIAPELDESFEGMEQSDLGGCCCDCCHKTWCNRCFGRFPAPPTSNQLLTPQMFNALCRLGYDLPADVLERL